jgi:hypothetical protein
MYKSPIDMLVTDIQHQIASQQDEQIYQAVVSVGVSVDKEELIRALNYDRDQYSKGYTDGKADIREFAKDVAYQFGYYCQNGGRLHITHGGLSTLEWAFDILGWENPHPVPECECEIDGCHEHATCGIPTNDGYKRMCGRHCREREGGK